MMQLPFLSISVISPLIGSLVILCLNYILNKRYSKLLIMLGKILILINLFISFYLLFNLNKQYNGTISGNIQFEEHYLWIETMGLNWHLGVNSISILFIILTNIISIISIFTILFSKLNNKENFVAYILMLNALCIGAFSAVNLLLFYIFFETTLIPMYLIIGIWGGSNRIYAAITFFLYSLAGSLSFLLGIIYIYIKIGSFNLSFIYESAYNLPKDKSIFVWIALFIGMAIKIPMVPVHGWLPLAHVQAPTAGSVFLAAILLKLGGYAMYKILIPILPNETLYFSSIIFKLSIIALIYGSFIALMQKDIKRLIAFSSIAHMAYVTAGLFSMQMEGFTGAIFQMLSHGFISAALFIIVGILYERQGTKEISNFGGLIQAMPKLSFCFIVAMLGSVGLPGLSGFIGEIMVILASFKFNITYGYFMASGILLGAVYMLLLTKKIIFDQNSDPEKQLIINKFKDLTFEEKISLYPLITIIVILGVMPHYIISWINFDAITLFNITISH